MVCACATALVAHRATVPTTVSTIFPNFDMSFTPLALFRQRSCLSQQEELLMFGVEVKTQAATSPRHRFEWIRIDEVTGDSARRRFKRGISRPKRQTAGLRQSSRNDFRCKKARMATLFWIGA